MLRFLTLKLIKKKKKKYAYNLIYQIRNPMNRFTFLNIQEKNIIRLSDIALFALFF